MSSMPDNRYSPQPFPGAEPPSGGSLSNPRVKGLLVVAAACLVLGSVITGWRMLRVVTGVRTALSEAEKAQRMTAVKNHLKELGVQFYNYETKYRAYPADEAAFSAFLRDTQTPGLGDLKCRQCSEKLTLLSTVAPTGHWMGSEKYPYAWGAQGINDAAPPDLPIAWHRCPEQDELAVLFFQGRVDVFAPRSETAAKIQALGRQK